MSQITHGVRSILSKPLLYDTFQRIMNTQSIRQELVNDFMSTMNGIRVLDIGCGTADIVGILPKGAIYYGYDISPVYIESAKLKYGSQGKFHCGLFDISQVDKLQPVDLVIANGVLHHLSDIEASNLFELAKLVLKPSGRVVTVDPCLIQNQNPIARFLINRDRGQNVRTLQAYQSLPSSYFSKINGKIRHREPIPYTDWVMVCHQ